MIRGELGEKLKRLKTGKNSPKKGGPEAAV
jgi:hypothetical protein